MMLNKKISGLFLLGAALFVGSIACMEEGPETWVINGESFGDFFKNRYCIREEYLGKDYDLIEYRYKGNISTYHAEPFLSTLYNTETSVSNMLAQFTKHNDNRGGEGESVIVAVAMYQVDKEPREIPIQHNLELDAFKKLITIGGAAPTPAPQKFDRRHVARVFDGPFLHKLSDVYQGEQYDIDYNDRCEEEEELDNEHTLFSDTGRVIKNDTSDERTVVYRSPSVHVKNDAESNSFWTTKQETFDEVTFRQLRKKDLEELGESAIRRTTTRETRTKVLAKVQPTALSYGLMGVALIAVAVKMYSWFGMGK